MTYTEAHIAALKAAIAQGVRKVSYESGGEKREVTYQSLAEMERTLGRMEAEVNPQSRPVRRTVAGYCPDL